MTLSKILILIAMSFSLVGCATKSLDLSVSDKEVFYEPPKDKALASLYLTCGKMAKDGHYEDSFIENNGSCDFAINGKKYSQISIGQVGRVDITAGKFTLNNSDGAEPVKDLDVKPRSLSDNRYECLMFCGAITQKKQDWACKTTSQITHI